MVWMEHLEPRLLLDAGLQGEYCTQIAQIDPAGQQVEAASPLEVGGQAAITGELLCWHKVTFTWAGPNASETAATNPFLDYRLNVTFVGPNGQTLVVPGYYAADGNAGNTGATGGDKWRAHLAPDEVGQWSYAVSFRTGAGIAVDDAPTAGTAVGPLDGDAGTFAIAATNKTGRDFRGKGLLEYVGGPYLRFAGTGEYFLKQGADAPENFLAYQDFDGPFKNDGRNDNYVKTWNAHVSDWQSGDPTWAAGKGKGIIGAVNYLASEGMNAFSFLPMNINGDDRNVFPYLDYNERYRMDVSRLDQWEVVFEHADAKGMFLHFKTQETENELLLDGGNLGTQRKLYYRELIARFSHHLALNWNLGEEINNASTAQKQAWAGYFWDHDPYRHHIVIHNGANHYDLLGGASQLTGFSLQTGQADFSDVHAAVLNYLDRSAGAGKPWAVACDEPGDASHALRPDNDAGTSHEDGRKNALWGTLLAGGWGNEWYFGYNHANSDLTCQDFRSRDAWWDQCRYALKFFNDNDIPFWQMSNDNALSSASNDYCFAKPGEVYVVYLKNGGSTNLDLRGVAGQFEVQWHDPRNGGALQAGSVRSVSGGGMRSLGNAPNETSKDWAILVRPGSGDPIANAGPDQSIMDADNSGAEQVTLDGSGSYDPGGSITSYVWSEGEDQIATGQSPTVALPVGAHTITLTVTDDEGADDADIVIVTVQEFTSQQTVDFNPTDDGSVDPGFKATTIRAQWDRGDRIGYFRFALSGIDGNVTDVKLKLRCAGDAGNGPMRVYQGSHSNWSESSTGSLPATGVRAGDLNQSYSIGTWYTWDLADHGITGDGVYTFILKHEVGGSDAWFDSRETSNDPVLQVTYAVAVPDPPTILSWSSAATHGGVGEILLAIPDDGTFSEPRNGGLRGLVVQFSKAIAPTSFTATSVQIAGLDINGNDVDLSGITITTSTRNGDRAGVVDLDAALPDVAKYSVRLQGVTDVAGHPLAGDSDRMLMMLVGDASGDGAVNASDYIALKRAFGSGVSSANARVDFDCSGTVDRGDLMALVAGFGQMIDMAASPELPEALTATATKEPSTTDGQLLAGFASPLQQSAGVCGRGDPFAASHPIEETLESPASALLPAGSGSASAAGPAQPTQPVGASDFLDVPARARTKPMSLLAPLSARPARASEAPRQFFRGPVSVLSVVRKADIQQMSYRRSGPSPVTLEALAAAPDSLGIDGGVALLTNDPLDVLAGSALRLPLEL